MSNTEAIPAAVETSRPAPGPLKRLWTWFWTPSGAFSLGTLVIVGFASGIIFWGGFNTAMEMTNTEEFCVSCHEMKQNVFVEYRNTAHYSNRSGVRAVCSDCHVPKDWTHKVVRKVQASNELLHKVLGSIDTPEKFEAKRLELAKNVWKAMKTTDSRECRNCHKLDYMDYAMQEPRASKIHQTAAASGATCIDCHQGIAHKLPPSAHEAYQTLVEALQEQGSIAPAQAAPRARAEAVAEPE
jgi:cytochrome c-type protein NapC